jgi:hypothetical protein
MIIKSNIHFKKIWVWHYTHVSSEVLCIVAAPCSASYNWTQNVWGTSGSIVAVTKVQCLCDVVAVIFGLGKFLVGGHEYINKHLYPTCLFGKGALKCYKSLKEGSGNMLLHTKLFTHGVNSIKNGWEKTDDAHCSGVPTSMMDECHKE